MKRRDFAAWLIGASCLVAGPVFAQAGGAVKIDLDKPATSAGSAKDANSTQTGSTEKSAPGGDSAAKSKAGAKAKKSETPPAKIDGQVISRGPKGYLGVKVDGGFKISFYDEKKQPVRGDVAGIALRWPVHYQPNAERAYLQPSGDGIVYVSEKAVRPPLTFKLFITLVKDAADPDGQPAESYVIDFQQS